jgi:hypothetical protein
MYHKKIRTIRTENYQCDGCGKTAEFVSEWQREGTSRESERIVDPDKGTWDISNGYISLSWPKDSEERERYFEAVYCSDACKEKAMAKALACAFEKKD